MAQHGVLKIPEYLEEKFGILLNEQQQLAIRSDSRHILLLAVPGSGKTTVLVSKIADLLINRKVPAQQVLTLTFSRESARDMGARFSALFGGLVPEQPKFSTIHSFCYQALQTYSKRFGRNFPKILSSEGGGVSRPKLLRDIFRKITEEYLSDDQLESLSNDICLAKNLMYSKEQIKQDRWSVDCFHEIYEEYERVKKANNCMDYDDLLCFTYQVFEKLPQLLGFFRSQYPYLYVDEAQDTSKIQHQLIRQLAQTGSLFMVGDEDQCIYTFRGAYPEGLMQFGDCYPGAEILKIEENFRSNSDLVSLANDFIKVNKNRYHKDMFCGNQEKGSVSLEHLPDYSRQYQKALEEIKQAGQGNSIAVLYRNNESAVPVIDMLQKNGIPYYIKEHNLRFFTSFVVEDMLAYYRLSADMKDIDAFERIYYKMMCSKKVFIYVKYQLGKYRTVFEAAADCPDTPYHMQKKLIQYETELIRIRTLRPVVSLSVIEGKAGYGEYLKKKASSGKNSVNLWLKLNILKTIAKGHQTVPEFVQGLHDLKSRIESRTDIQAGGRVFLSSIHSSKGLEFDTVLLIDFMDSIIPTKEALDLQDSGQDGEMENEARLFYVAATRAKKRLVVYTSKYCNDEYVLQSRFLTRYLNQPPKALRHTREQPVPSGVPAGQVLTHKFFGQGMVVSGGDSDTLTVDFGKYGMKQISYQFCMQNDTIQLEHKMKQGEGIEDEGN